MRHFARPKTRGAGRAFPAGAVLFAALAGCSVSTQQEVQLGTNYAAQIDTQLPLVRDPEVVRYINVLGDSLSKVTDTRDLQWHFTVVDSKEVNAFAVPGGFVYVNRGLIERAQTLSQVAGVIGHEIGHVTQRHTVKQMQKSQGANIGVLLACTLTSVCNTGLGQAGVSLTGSAIFAKFSRSDEAQADEEGVKTVIKAGIDPEGIPEMFRILLDERKTNPSGVDGFFLSHPLEEDRIAATRRQIGTYPASALQGLTRDSPGFQAFKRRLISLPPSPEPRKRR